MKFATQIFCSTDECLKDETCLLLLEDCSLVTLHTFVFIHVKSVGKPADNFMVTNVSQSCLIAAIAELCILVMFRYIFSALTTSSVRAIRKTSSF